MSIARTAYNKGDGTIRKESGSGNKVSRAVLIEKENSYKLALYARSRNERSGICVYGTRSGKEDRFKNGGVIHLEYDKTNGTLSVNCAELWTGPDVLPVSETYFKFIPRQKNKTLCDSCFSSVVKIVR